jgi:AraC family transcriptional regulator
MRAGDIIVAPAGPPRILRHKEETELAKVLLTPALVDEIVRTVAPERASQIELLDNFGTRDSSIEELVRRLIAELRADDVGSGLCAESLATELAVHLIRNYSTARRPAAVTFSALPRSKLQRVTDYIHDNLREELTLEKISQTLSMSPYHFAHVFKQAVGVAPHHYVVKCRIDRAKALLRGTDLSVTEIASQVGYSNLSHFSVAFHKRIGQTPSRYRSES